MWSGALSKSKSTFCLARENHAFISHHIGDLENLETFQSFVSGIEHFKRLFQLKPEIVACDLHPEYLSTKFALSLDDLTHFSVQHHHAHVASCMADNQIDGDVIGVAMDGLGFGTDGRLWGGEFFAANFLDAERLVHFDYVPMPGGTKAVREPWRMAAMYLHRAFGDDFLKLDLPITRNIDAPSWKTLNQMAGKGVNSPLTSSVGRLFDAVGALLGLRETINYEGQAAIEVEAIADLNGRSGYVFEIDANSGVVRAESVIRQIVDDLLRGMTAPAISARFHLGVAGLIATVAREIRSSRHLNRVVLSGGVFQNMLVLENSRRLLQADQFEVFTHKRVPANDGGISLGQVMVANAHFAAGRI